MTPARARRERQIKLFDAHQARQAFHAIARRGGGNDFSFLDFLDDETVDAIAKDLLTNHFRSRKINERNRAMYAADRVKVTA